MPTEFAEEKRALLDQRKAGLLRMMGAHLGDPENVLMAVCSLKRGERGSKFREKTGVGDDINGQIPWDEKRDDALMALMALGQDSLSGPQVPPFMRFAALRRRKAAMLGLGRRGKIARPEQTRDRAREDEREEGPSR